MALLIRTSANKSLFLPNYNKLLSCNFLIKSIFRISRNLFVPSRCCQRHSHQIPIFNDHIQITNASSDSNCSTIKNNKGYGSYEKILSGRRNEAKRSIIVQVQSANSYKDLYSYCHEFGTIENIYHYTVAKSSHFILVQFKEISAYNHLIDAATHMNSNDFIPVHSQMLWFRHVPKRTAKIMKNIPEMVSNLPNPTDDTTFKVLESIPSISDQMKMLYETCKLDDVEIRLRFITALQMETSFMSLFPNIAVFPFGSSVNGFGRRGCDLDLVLNLEYNKVSQANSRLIFHTKSALSEERAQIKRSMEIIANVMQAFLPGVNNVRRILHARVPILKYNHTLTGVECDLSMTNMTAMYMSELLFLFGEINPNVRPLVFTIRQWASSVGITNDSPGCWITNFSLTLMVLFYMQSEQLLPTLDYLRDLANDSDVRLVDEFSDCTFVRDIKKLPIHEPSNKDLQALLHGFYEFYADFDFTHNALSLREGRSIYKPNPAALYICNPLEKALNVSKNVNHTEVTRFITAVRDAAMLLNEGTRSYPRGLPDIFVGKQPKKKKLGKRINIAGLFQSDDTNVRTKEDSNNTTKR